ncbi:hypothetical protein Paride_0462 [Pseudomonas phage Paride]|nr:hypothetical protein Paride_0462 [Pseudomonas phage Paride]
MDKISKNVSFWGINAPFLILSVNTDINNIQRFPKGVKTCLIVRN